jgi:uncharacterized protein (DUF924 family)
MNMTVMDQLLPTQDILHYWFGEHLEDAVALKRQSRRWFRGGAELDREIQVRFGERIKPVAQLTLSQFGDAEQALAAVILFDQFPRHIFRGQAQAFAFDDKAVALVQKALAAGWHKRLHPVQQTFLFMPLQHAENDHLQAQSVSLYQQLVDEARLLALAGPVTELLEDALNYAKLHREIVERFGRFPHRNKALARQNTAEEQDYLVSARRFGQ